MSRLWLWLLFFPGWAWGYGEVEDLAELALLPNYCKGAQQIRAISNDPKPLQEYVALYGEGYMHIQHYCWALNQENKLPRLRDEQRRQSELISILSNIQYVLDRSPANFTLLPEIYLGKARILFKMERDVEAVGTLFKLTQFRPDYGPAYDQLGSYYQHTGDKRNAIKVFEQGLRYTPEANRKFFTSKIKALDKNHPIPPPLPHNTTEEAHAPPATKNQEAASAVAAPPDASPYCRFCP